MAANQETTLASVVSDRLLSIADYQRPFAWGDKQLTDLWEDLDLMGSDGQHYFGTLVLRETADENGRPLTSVDAAGQTLRHTEVIDGQQRLTSCILLLDRARRRLERLAADGVDGARAVADHLRRAFGVVLVDGAPVPRLQLGVELNGFWVDIALGDEVFLGQVLLTGQQRLEEAIKFFDQKLDQLIAGIEGQVALDRIRDLQRRVTSGLRVLVYEVVTSAEVGVIFETLNERGRPLTELEKTKNYLLYLARQIPDRRSDDLASIINVRWSEIFASLAQQDPGMEEQVLRVHWLVTQDPDQRLWQGVGSIKARFDRARYVPASARLGSTPEPVDSGDDEFGTLYSDLKDYVSTLHQCAQLFAEMFDPNGRFAALGSSRPSVLGASASLLRTNVLAPFRPLLCAARLAYPTDGAFYSLLVEHLERYSARVMVICGRRTNAGRSKLNSLAHSLYSRTMSQENILSTVRVLIWRYASDDAVREALESQSENWYERSGHKYFLYEYELALMGAGQIIPAFAEFTTKGNEKRTTEHILPQHPNEDARCWWDRFTPDEHVALRHSLGNLVLTLDNSSYSNKCFDAKRGRPMGPGEETITCYAQSSLHQERELATFSDWTPATIRQRQLHLTEWALGRWAVEAPGLTVLEDEDEDIENDDDV
jgi:hypothetical protein